MIILQAKFAIIERDRAMSDVDQPSEQAELAAKALALKEANEAPPHHPTTEDHADEGPQLTPRPDQPPSGAFEAEGHRPVLERSRKVR
jgi:hypothetical protein